MAGVKAVLNSDRQLSLQLIADEVGVAKTQVFENATGNLNVS